LGVSPLAGGLVENDGSRGGYVKRADATGHGNAEKVIAGAANEIVKSRALAAENHYEIAGEIEVDIRNGAALVETDNPEVATLDIFEGADEIDDARDAEMLGSAGTGLYCGRAEGGGAALGEENTVDAGAIGDTQKRAEVLRVLDPVKRKEEPWRYGAGGIGCEEIFESERFVRANEGHDTLMSLSFGGKRELVARFVTNPDAQVAALGEEARDARVGAVAGALAGDEDVIETAASGLESFRNRVQTVENFHGIQCKARDAKGAGRWRPC
jgi:hypothetical protein